MGTTLFSSQQSKGADMIASAVVAGLLRFIPCEQFLEFGLHGFDFVSGQNFWPG